MSPPFLSSALIYAQRYRWPVFPLVPREKRPITSHGLLDATIDEAQIREWWAKWPDANVGIRTGDGLVVIDGDRRKQGHLTLRDLFSKHGRFPPTYTVITSDGRHYYFKSEIPMTSVGDSLGPGVDVKGQGGYVVAPPSVHPSGHLYQYDVQSQSRPVELPSWAPIVAEEIAHRDGGTRLDRERVLAGLPEGERDRQLFCYASWLRNIKFPHELATEVVSALARRCVPPFPEGAAVGKVDWVYSHYAEGRAPSHGGVELYDAE